MSEPKADGTKSALWNMAASAFVNPDGGCRKGPAQGDQIVFADGAEWALTWCMGLVDGFRALRTAWYVDRAPANIAAARNAAQFGFLAFLDRAMAKVAADHASKVASEEPAKTKPHSVLGTVDTECRCGWKLPLGVTAMKDRGIHHVYEEDDLLPDAVTQAVCPDCDRGHLFVSVNHPTRARKELLGT